ncbi:hypothetical protein V6N13_106811 [Hibiscus sabdariffa]
MQPNPATEAPARPSEPAPVTPTIMFGPWMVVEKRQHRLQPKEVNGRGISSGVTITESRFAPILDASINDSSLPALQASTDGQLLVPPATNFPRSSTMKQSTFPKRVAQPKSALSKQASATSKIRGKSSNATHQTAISNVRKPLQLNLADFPILSCNGHKIIWPQ